MDLCDLIIDAKKKGRIKKNVIFNCQAKVGDFIIKKPVRKLHDDLIIKLKEAGFYHFGTGVETFSDKLLKVQSINKKISEADQHMVINGLLKHGFSPSVNLILFFPESTVEDMYSTMKTATEYMLKGVQIAMTPLLRPNPGSGIHELITKGLTPIKAKWVEWKNPDTGKIWTIEEIAAKTVPTGYKYKIVEDSDVPTDRSFRNAWTVDEADLTDGVGS